MNTPQKGKLIDKISIEKVMLLVDFIEALNLVSLLSDGVFVYLKINFKDFNGGDTLISPVTNYLFILFELYNLILLCIY